MPKHRHGGLSKLKFYCQPCQKQCRDEHGFQLHTQSLSHATKTKNTSSRQQVYTWSQEFQSSFLKVLNGFNGVITANKVYSEFIKDETNVRMNATKWSSLTAFINHLAKCEYLMIISSEPELIIKRRDIEKENRDKKVQEIRSEKEKIKNEAELRVQAMLAESARDHSSTDDEPDFLTKESNVQNLNEKPVDNTQEDHPIEINKPAVKPKISFSLKKKK
ncbi:Rts2 protein [Starmerella bacillaris]|uniref:Rts2 protein n=1 Tax=Starmerella bacillaris TaxID=1247836 RepID=A0AAV5RQK0_STABA|nr:Rts2 protein [Starmerella bacillaris]